MGAGMDGIFGAAGIGLLVAIAVAAIAPLAFSVLARNIGSVLTSIALLFGAGGLFLTGKTVIHEVLAAVLYMAALLSASMLYAAAQVRQGLKEEGAAMRALLRESAQPPAQSRTEALPQRDIAGGNLSLGSDDTRIPHRR